MHITRYKKEEEYFYYNNDDPDLKPIIFKLEDIPNDNKIHNYNLPTNQQIYRHSEPPQKLLALMRRCKKIQKADTKKNPFINDVINREIFSNQTKYDDIIRWIENEWRRRLYGDWYFIGGKRIYVSGLMCYWMDYWMLEHGLPTYKDANRRYFQFVTESINDKDCYGIMEVTKRRDGKSKRASCVMYEAITRDLSGRGGIQSKNDDDARDFYRNHILYGFKHMPFWFQPVHTYHKEPQAELFFDGGTVQGDDQLSLRSMIDYKPAKPLAYDGSRLTFYISDEGGKLETYDVKERWEKVKPVLRSHDGTIIGKSIHTTTVEDGGVYGMDKFKKLWDASDFHKRNELNQTESGLWRLFQPAYDGYLVDNFGYSLLEKSKSVLKEQRKLIDKNSSGYAEEIRKYPLSIREAFTISANGCPFAKDILMRRVEYFFGGNQYVVQGDFLWENGVQDSKVVFVPNSLGRFFVSYLPSESMNNQIEMISGKKTPGNKTKFIAGADTFNYDKTDSQGSNGGGAVFMPFNPILEGNLKDMNEFSSEEDYNNHLLKYKTERFVCTYSYRPPTKSEYVEDMIKMCVFYGCFMFPELNFDHVQTGFKKRGYEGYLLHKYDKKTSKFKTNSGDVTNENTKDNLFRVVGEYIKTHGSVEFHDELLKECLKVTYSSMTDYDLFAASAYALYGKEFLNVWYKREERKNQNNNNGGKGTNWFNRRSI